MPLEITQVKGKIDMGALQAIIRALGDATSGEIEVDIITLSGALALLLFNRNFGHSPETEAERGMFVAATQAALTAASRAMIKPLVEGN